MRRRAPVRRVSLRQISAGRPVGFIFFAAAYLGLGLPAVHHRPDLGGCRAGATMTAPAANIHEHKAVALG
jgi:hypothetical protein